MQEMMPNTIPTQLTESVPVMIPIKKAAAITGLSYDYIRNGCLEGKIVHIRTGNKYMINLNKLIALLNGEE